ncbi:vacuolar protein sorting-associated protein 26-domain-containing protein [Dunaliella salina]|uniref:Vacuolar protein sorting-associated protein 26-domain-containing protein n=2 Tax=Dunaliella salina TaxID=3046 RepID=A0ABQ7GLB5_DUNSA|nr:vacuolar protein sorting-associated protein 26-domain-containing protein [Dunaliella salina]|eukprot:KAF5835363.1 vacuolar protein sorting-associated protein 26-domain-containing protein [Dunaliella salina]
MKSILGYIQGAPFRIDTEFLDAQGKPYKNTTPVKGKKDVVEDAPVYANRDTVKGLVKITPMTTKKLEHMGIKAQLLGRIDVSTERGAKQEFMSMARGLAGSGEIGSPITLPFEFPNVEMQYDSYKGQQMEVGIEDCLHIEFEYDRARYHLQDVVVGKIYFLLVSPLYLSPYDLSPTYKDVHNKYSVRYFLNLVLVDEEDRRYFKQQEITLYRKRPPTPEEAAAAAANPAPPPRLVQTPPMFNSDALLPAGKALSRSNSATSGVTIQKKSPPRPAPQPYHAAALAAAKSRQASRSSSLQNSRSNSLSQAGGTAIGDVLAEVGDKAAAAVAERAAGRANGGWMDGPLSPPPRNRSPTPEGPRTRLPGVEPRHPTRFAPSSRLQSPQMSYVEPSLPVSSTPPPPSYEQQAAAPAASPPPPQAATQAPAAAPPVQGAFADVTGGLASPAMNKQQQPEAGGSASAPNSPALAEAGSPFAAAPIPAGVASATGPEGGAVGSPFAATSRTDSSAAGNDSPFAAASRAASIAAGGVAADPIFGGAQGDVGGDLEPLSFGNLEDEGKN